MENKWLTVKKVDILGKSNLEKKNGILIATPHVHEADSKSARPAKLDEIPKQ